MKSHWLSLLKRRCFYLAATARLNSGPSPAHSATMRLWGLSTLTSTWI